LSKLTKPELKHEQERKFDEFWNSYWLDVQAIGPLTYTRFRLMLREIRKNIAAPPRHILDIGCGSGGMLRLLARKYPGADRVGIEPSAAARAALPAALSSQVLAGGVLELEGQLPAERADLVVCSEVLEHVQQPGEVLGSLVRLAAPGALLIVTVPAGMRHWSVQDTEAGHLTRFEPDEFQALLKSANLQTLHLYTWGGPVSWMYNHLINALGPARAAHSGRSWLGRAVARLITLALRIDDLFVGRRGFQLIAAVRKPA
jgi:2-polyprenyl-3-methyl-5-hydroxy-6-metoxy-1,4-benzoquinol methylase